MQQFTIPQQTVEEMVAAVRRAPGYEDWDSFSDRHFQEDEVEWKRAASKKVRELMSEASIPASFDAADDVETFLKTLEAGFTCTHMLASPVGDIGVVSLKALSADQKQSFCLAMRDLLFGDGPTPERLDRFQAATQGFAIKNRWAFATHFLFFLHPDSELLVRPQAIHMFLKKAGSATAWSDKPNGRTYAAINALAQALLARLRPRGAQDMVDVQSFVWLWWRAPAVPPPPVTRQSWVFQSVPKAYDLQGAVSQLPRIAWRVKQHPKEIHPGDEVFLWESGTPGAIHAVTEVESEPAILDADPAEAVFIRDPAVVDPDVPCVWIRIAQVVTPPVERAVLRADPILESVPVFGGMTGTNFALTAAQADALRALIAHTGEQPPTGPRLGFDDLRAKLREQELYFPPEAVANYLLALQTKRFVILSGISGTGKTKLAQAVADCCANDGGVQVIPVRPDWTDNRGLLGYYNPLTGKYSTTDLLELLRAADADPGRPYFVILDEMNLARVEHYFSDFLSCLESGKPLPLHDQGEPVAASRPGVKGMPANLPIPRNVFFTGTVNVDETTFMFSPKVIDRAFTIELNEVDLQRLAAIGADGVAGVSETCRLALAQWPGELVFHGNPDANAWKALGQSERETLMALHALLEKHNRHFGYRVACEIARFVLLAGEQAGPEGVPDALDLAILQKVLPKFHGTRAELQEVLKELLAFAIGDTGATLVAALPAPDDNAGADDSGEETTTEQESASAPDSKTVEKAHMPRAAAKVRRMLARLEKQGFTAYME